MCSFQSSQARVKLLASAPLQLPHAGMQHALLLADNQGWNAAVPDPARLCCMLVAEGISFEAQEIWASGVVALRAPWAGGPHCRGFLRAKRSSGAAS